MLEAAFMQRQAFRGRRSCNAGAHEAHAEGKAEAHPRDGRYKSSQPTPHAILRYLGRDCRGYPSVSRRELLDLRAGSTLSELTSRP
ncbi:MAG: hypothetical protein NVS9B2_13360 [Steroidobacteraceae bacterium]